MLTMWVALGAQYPGEKEITFPPFTCLEADGDPRVEHFGQGEVVIFPLKVLTPIPSQGNFPHP
jgi:hypothetical protein